MRSAYYSFVAVCLAAVATASPLLRRQAAFDSTAAVGNLTSAQILVAAPNAASCDTATSSECADAATAAEFINQAFSNYGITSLGQKAALLSWMTLESDDFIYSHNVSPGIPGQGTKVMMAFRFVYSYATSIPELKAKALQLGGGTDLVLTASTQDGVAVDVRNNVLDLVVPNEYAFGAAPWFLTTQCTAATTDAVSSGGYEGFAGYLTDCVGTPASDDRIAKWCSAVKAMKPDSMALPTQCGSYA